MCEFCKTSGKTHITKSSDDRGKKFDEAQKKMLKAVSAYLNKLKDFWLQDIQNVQLPTIINKEQINDEELNNILKAMEGAVVLGMNEQNKAIMSSPFVSVDIGINNEFVDKYVKNRTAQLISGIDQTAKQEIQKLIDSAFTDGLSIDDISKKITEEFFIFSDYRAELISQMETANAFETGKLEQFRGYEKNLGTTGWKRALTQGDGNVRAEHQVNADQGWILSTQLFSGTGSETAPFGFNCRCTVQFSIVNPETGSLF